MVKRLAAALEPSARGVVSPFLLEAAVASAVLALLVLAELHLDGALGLAVRAAVVVALGLALLAAARRLRLRAQVVGAIAQGLDDLGEAVLVVDQASGLIVHASPAAEEVYGRPAAALIGLDAGELAVTPEDRATVEERRRLRAAGHRLPGRTTMAVADPAGRERHVEWATVNLDAASLLSVARDVTPRIAAERRLAEECLRMKSVVETASAAEARARRAHAALDLRSKELERSNADLAEFAALASEDLRAPIHAVSGFADLLEADAAPALAPRDRSYLTALREAAGHAEEMLDGLAAYGRLGHGEALARDVDCEGTLDAVLADLAGELEARDAVVTREPLPVVPGDPEELRTLFANLIANAVRHGAPAAPRVHVGAERRGLGWQLTFADDGEGVPDGERQRIFQLFRRLHPRGAQRGSGVGLALCRRIVERHGGAIWVDDAEDGGSVFFVSLPDREAR